MAKGPAVVFIARHGARLDQADKQWHLTSPTPFDPPLTYGGWAQSKALGLRIAALLHQREKENNGGSNGEHNGDTRPQPTPLPHKKRRHRIVIHTSPYLRCLQTSTGIAAGLAQFQPPLAPTHSHGPHKVLLRVDAFLGEWLCPDYFKDITSPPPSTLMVKSAKEELAEKGDYIEVHHGASASQGHFPGGWAGKSGAVSKRGAQDSSVPTMGAPTSPTLLHRERSNSQGGLAGARARSRGPSSLETAHHHSKNIYSPPVPSYAVGPLDSIPRGYVAHARDACVEVDHHWDSMRPPQGWGDGGEYDDEWSTMNKRFRKGLGGMMTWYKEHGLPASHYNKLPSFSYHPGTPANGHTSGNGKAIASAEEEEDLVLVLVTHGAGCHAMLNAITTKQEIIDIGLASVTMAVRRDEARMPSSPSLFERRSPIPDAGMAYEYDLKIKASVDHLRPDVDPSKTPRPQPVAPPIGTRPSLDTRRFGSTGAETSPITQWIPGGGSQPSKNSSLGSIRRTFSSGSSSSRYMSNNANGPVSPSVGLWSSAPLSPGPGAETDGGKSPGHDMFPNFSNVQPARGNRANGNGNAHIPNVAPKDQASSATASTSPPTTTLPLRTAAGTAPPPAQNEKERAEQNDAVPPLPGVLARSLSVQSSQSSQGGLWGARQEPAPSPGLWGPPRLDDVVERDIEHNKRRWTVTERESEQ